MSLYLLILLDICKPRYGCSHTASHQGDLLSFTLPTPPISQPSNFKFLIYNSLLAHSVADMLSCTLKKKQVDQFLSHLHRTIESRDRRDVVLLFAGEAMRLLSFILTLLSSHLSKVKNIKHLKRLLCGSRMKSIAASTARAANYTIAFTTMLDEWQMMNRLWGVLDMWMAAREIKTQISKRASISDPVNPIDVAIQVSQTLCLTSFHICEAASFLSSKGITNLSAKTQERLSFFAIRSWTAFTMVEVGRLLLDGQHTPHDKEKVATDDWKVRWRKNMLQNLAWLSVSVHWSLRNGLLPESLVSPLAVFATWSLVKDAWKEAAEPNNDGSN